MTRHAGWNPINQALQALQQVSTCNSQHTAHFLTIMVDESVCVSGKEQLVIRFLSVNSSLLAREDYVGLYHVESTQASVIVTVVCDALQRLNMSITKLKGECYDGASSMSGYRRGVATKGLEEEPRAVYTHCNGYALNFASSNT